MVYSIHNSFGTGGIIITPEGIASDDANAFILKFNCKIITEGHSNIGKDCMVSYDYSEQSQHINPY